MALLNPRAQVVVAAVLIASCNGDSEVGGIEVDLFDSEVDCELGADCLDAYGQVAEFERIGGFAFLTTETSAHHPDGLFLYFELERPDGAIGRGELDIPLRGEGETTVAYRELRDGEEVFVAVRAVGVVEVPEEAFGEQCDCLDGRFELVLYDDEGATRRLGRGRFGWEDRPCIGRVRFTEFEEELTVIPRTCDPGREPYVTPSSPPPREAYDTTPTYYSSDGCDTSACNGTAGSAASCGSAGAGCGSGGGGCDGGGGGGCEGDVGGSGGCGGDVGGGGGCAGDTGGCHVTGPRRVGPRGPLQTGLLIAAALAWVIRPRRYK